MALSKTKSTYDVDAIWTHADNKSAKEWKQSHIYIFSFLISFSESFYYQIKLYLLSVFKDNLVGIKSLNGASPKIVVQHGNTR